MCSIFNNNNNNNNNSVLVTKFLTLQEIMPSTSDEEQLPYRGDFTDSDSDFPSKVTFENSGAIST